MGFLLAGSPGGILSIYMIRRNVLLANLVAFLAGFLIFVPRF